MTDNANSATQPKLPTLDDAKKATEDVLAGSALPGWASTHAHSSSDQLPVRPYSEKLPNGTVIVHN
jgi:hypothetical protein